MSNGDERPRRRRFTGSITALWSAVTGRKAERPQPSYRSLTRRWEGATLIGQSPSMAPAAIPPPDDDGIDRLPTIERERDGVVASYTDGLLEARIDGPVPGFSLIPARDAAPPSIRGDRVAGQIAMTDPACAAARKALQGGALFEEGRWKKRLPGEADPDAIVAWGELLIDAARDLRAPVPGPVRAWANRPASIRLRLLILCHFDGHPDTGKVRSMALRDADDGVRGVAEGLRSKGYLPTLIRPPVPGDLRGEMIGRLDHTSRATALATVLADPDPGAAVAVVPHLAADGVAALMPALVAPHPDVRVAAVRALMNATGDKLTPATDAINDRDPRVVRAAATVLAWFGGETQARAMRARAAAAGPDTELHRILEEAARVIIERYDRVGRGDHARRSLGYPSIAEERASQAPTGVAPPDDSSRSQD